MEIQESVKNKLAVLIQNIGEATAEVRIVDELCLAIR